MVGTSLTHFLLHSWMYQRGMVVTPFTYIHVVWLGHNANTQFSVSRAWWQGPHLPSRSTVGTLHTHVYSQLCDMHGTLTLAAWSVIGLSFRRMEKQEPQDVVYATPSVGLSVVQVIFRTLMLQLVVWSVVSMI